MIRLQATNLSAETALKQVGQYTKVISHVYDMVCKAREEWEVESSARAGVTQSSNTADTHALLAAVGMGKGLKNTLAATSGAASPSGSTTTPTTRAQGTNGASPAPATGKAPSGIKMNIKSANQVHPYTTRS